MTPIGHRLSLHLDEEVVRMANEWFFKWHHIGSQNSVEIESFRGKPICYGGIKFSGSAQAVYWDTIQHYLRKKISSLFDDLERELKDYPFASRAAAIDEVANLVKNFSHRIRRMAIEKDRVLRSDILSFPFTSPSEKDLGSWGGSKSDDIDARADALKQILVGVEIRKSNFSTKANEYIDKHRWWIGLLGLISAVIGYFCIRIDWRLHRCPIE